MPKINNPTTVVAGGGDAFAQLASGQLIAITEKDLKGVVNIAANVFAENATLQSVAIPEGVETIGDKAFYNDEALAGLSLPDSVEEIGAQAFSGCALSGQLIISSGCKTIGSSAFSGNEGITQVSLPEGLEKIGTYAFGGIKLASITIPSTVTEIGENMIAIYDFTSSLNVTMLPTTPPNVPRRAEMTQGQPFTVRNLTVHVPAGCGAAYRSAPGWSLIADDIIEG